MAKRVYIPDPPRRPMRQRSSFSPPVELAWTPPPTELPSETPARRSPPKERLSVLSSKQRVAVREPPPHVTTSVESEPTPSTKVDAATKKRKRVPQWILQVRKVGMLELAEVLGLHVDEDRMRPCPNCDDDAGAELYRNKQGWLLWRCEECGLRDRGNVDLVSYALAGEKAGDLPPDQKDLLRQWFADQGWCASEEEGQPVS